MKKTILIIIAAVVLGATTLCAQNINLQKSPADNTLVPTSKIIVVPAGGSITAISTGIITATNYATPGDFVLNKYLITRLTGGTSTDLDALALTNLANGTMVRLCFTGSIVADYRLRAKTGGETAVAQWLVVSTVDSNRVWELVTPPSKQGVPAIWNPSTSKFHQILIAGTGNNITSGIAPESAAFLLP